ncbi:MAG TPA: OsmC family protein [Bryobacteraceae bacterium]|nr:OsmC family protein [Bryobacteraceae bacterium]
MKTTHATLQYAGDELFVGISPSGHAQVIDVNSQRSAGPSPTELLLLSLGGCTAADVISILHKKREVVTDYRIEVRGERREEHPRSYRRFEVHHIVRGRGVSEKSVQQAVELSSEKYCGVAATVRPTAEVVVTWTVEQEP